MGVSNALATEASIVEGIKFLDQPHYHRSKKVVIKGTEKGLS
jgi:hypothetical protein